MKTLSINKYQLSFNDLTYKAKKNTRKKFIQLSFKFVTPLEGRGVSRGQTLIFGY